MKFHAPIQGRKLPPRPGKRVARPAGKPSGFFLQKNFAPVGPAPASRNVTFPGFGLGGLRGFGGQKTGAFGVADAVFQTFLVPFERQRQVPGGFFGVNEIFR